MSNETPRGLTTKDRGAELQKILDARMVQIAKALPPGTMTPDHFARVVLTLCGKNPKLMECNGPSLLGAVMQSAQLGLSPDPVLGEAWFVPFKQIVTFIPGYKGLIKLGYQSNMIARYGANAVREGDEFDYSDGSKAFVHHKKLAPHEAPIIAAWALSKIKGGDNNHVVLLRSDIEARRKRSPAVRSGKSTPWDTDYAAMAMKTALRDVSKLGPSSVHPPLAKAVTLDEQAENGIKQHLATPFLAAGEAEPDQEEIDEQALSEAARAAENNQPKE